jgi:hypothetical protein
VILPALASFLPACAESYTAFAFMIQALAGINLANA